MRGKKGREEEKEHRQGVCERSVCVEKGRRKRLGRDLMKDGMKERKEGLDGRRERRRQS